MFISIILDPSRIWSDHGVVDTERQVLVCKCSDARDADLIAKVLNIHKSEREAVALIPENSSCTTPISQ